ncbi:alpha/beta fold hydrolase [Pseudonocardia sp. NPDC049154]|uniref:alpha/beta hydrolase n=1 Tax=Pseudonocardia sp. NPDC049154 TaxID=3155501 RepID=UPI0033FF470D
MSVSESMDTASRVREALLDVGDGLRLSVLLAEPDGPPRGTLLALHGGGARAAYWHSPVAPDAGLLELGACLGWRVLAPDRPGYGASADRTTQGWSAADQGRLLERALAAVGAGTGPVVLVGHSLGAIVAAHLAARGRPAGLVAVAVGGVPLVFTPEQTQGMAGADLSGPVMTRRSDGPRPDPTMWYGPAGSWDPRLLEHRRALVTGTPTLEFLDARDAPSGLPPLFARISVPVQFAVAAHERTTAPPEALLAAADAALTAAPARDLLLVSGSGHNLSLGGMARAYHLRVLAFAEAALARV